MTARERDATLRRLLHAHLLRPDPTSWRVAADLYAESCDGGLTCQCKKRRGTCEHLAALWRFRAAHHADMRRAYDEAADRRGAEFRKLVASCRLAAGQAAMPEGYGDAPPVTVLFEGYGGPPRTAGGPLMSHVFVVVASASGDPLLKYRWQVEPHRLDANRFANERCQRVMDDVFNLGLAERGGIE